MRHERRGTGRGGWVRFGRSIGLAAALAGATALSGLGTGCKGGGARRAPRTSAAAYTGPAVEIDSSGPQHVLVLRAPSAGWSLGIDRTERKLRVNEVYLTASRPDPAFMHAQQVVSLRAGTGIDSNKPVAAFVRVVDHGAATGSYSLAARSR